MPSFAVSHVGWPLDKLRSTLVREEEEKVSKNLVGWENSFDMDPERFSEIARVHRPQFENCCTRKKCQNNLGWKMCVYRHTCGALELRQSVWLWLPCAQPVQRQQVRVGKE